MAVLPVVFLGLSLSADDAHQILLADYRRPVRKGDLDRISPPADVAIIDGVLDSQDRLPRSEARRALQRGLKLYGASSTGALLASELEDIGMIGVGQVFRFLRRHPGERDDLVSLLYFNGEEQPLTVPIINIILGYRDLGLPNGQLDELIQVLLSIPLERRTWETIEMAVKDIGLELPHAVRFRNAKAEDARLLLKTLRSEVDISRKW